MSQSFYLHLLEWDAFKRDWEAFAEGKSTRDDFWRSEPTFHDFCERCAACGPNVFTGDGDDGIIHSMPWVDMEDESIPKELKGFWAIVSKMICEGGTSYNDLNDPRINAVNIVHGLYSPQSASEIATYWEAFNLELSLYGEYLDEESYCDWKDTHLMIKPWIDFFIAAKAQGKGVLSLVY